MPRADDLDLDGLDTPVERVELALRVDPDQWRAEVVAVRKHFDEFGDRLPEALRDELGALEERLEDA